MYSTALSWFQNEKVFISHILMFSLNPASNFSNANIVSFTLICLQGFSQAPGCSYNQHYRWNWECSLWCKSAGFLAPFVGIFPWSFANGPCGTGVWRLERNCARISLSLTKSHIGFVHCASQSSRFLRTGAPAIQPNHIAFQACFWLQHYPKQNLRAHLLHSFW